MRRRTLGPIVAAATLLVPTAAPPPSRADGPGDEYRAALRKTAEARERRRRRGAVRPSGAIVPYPLPPALVIRQTPEAHDEIRDLLRWLRGH